jgi:hypothetical protein
MVSSILPFLAASSKALTGVSNKKPAGFFVGGTRKGLQRYPFA